jgi:hypothetical protein
MDREFWELMKMTPQVDGINFFQAEILIELWESFKKRREMEVTNAKT